MKETQKIIAEDFVKLKFVNTPTLSPDGTELLFAIKKLDNEKNTYKSTLYIKKQGSPTFSNI